MTDQTNTAAYWLDVANVAEQSNAAAIELHKNLDGHCKYLAGEAMAACRILRKDAMNLRNALAVKEIEEAADASR